MSGHVVIDGNGYTIIGFVDDVIYLSKEKSVNSYWQYNLKTGKSSLARYDGQASIYHHITVDDMIRNYRANYRCEPSAELIQQWEAEIAVVGYVTSGYGSNNVIHSNARNIDDLLKDVTESMTPPVGIWETLSERQRSFTAACVDPNAMMDKVIPSIKVTGGKSEYTLQRNTNTKGVYVKEDPSMKVADAILSITDENIDNSGE